MWKLSILFIALFAAASAFQSVLKSPVSGRRRQPPALYSSLREDVVFEEQVQAAQEQLQKTIPTRRHAIASALLTAGTLLQTDPAKAAAAATEAETTAFRWKSSPINKRSGIRLEDAENAGYNVQFVTYLSRFLLSFDQQWQRWWFAQSERLPAKASKEEINDLRLEQFGQFSASVEVGLLQDYVDPAGPSRLLQSLLARYCPDSSSMDESKKREVKEARRQIALLFGLLTDIQPVEDLTKLLAAIDNASIDTVQLLNNTETAAVSAAGYATGEEPAVQFPPPEAGETYEPAQGRAVMKPTGSLLRIDVVDGGAGYSAKSPPVVTISAPTNDAGNNATAKAKVVSRGPNQGSLESIQIVNGGSGYTENDDIVVTVSSFATDSETRDAVLVPVLEQYVAGVEITKQGTGYAAEKPLRVFVQAPGKTSLVNGTIPKDELIQIGTAIPRAEKTSYSRFRTEADTKKIRDFEAALEKRYVSGAQSGSSPASLPFWAGKSASSKLLSLLKDGVGLEYDTNVKRYVLAVDSTFQEKFPSWKQTFSDRPLDPQFGPRGRSPIERNKELDVSTYLRFVLSGAICASGVHLVLTPLDVVKTKVQTDPVKYPTVGESFLKVYKEEAFSTFFAGWIPTFVGNFFLGGVLYGFTEIIRRNLIEVAGADASRLEVPIILAAAGIASFIGAFVACPFEAVRIRQVAQPEFAPGAGGVVKRMYAEEGIGSFVNAIPVFMVKNVPYAMVKFTVFDLSTERLYEAYPAANEDLKLSLLISLVGGILGGTAAAIVSNPADAVISELKKAKSDMSPQEALAILLGRAGIPALFKGLPLRMVFSPLLASMQFLVYDSVRFSLGIGSDDLKLYLDVLGGALQETGGPI